jgi:hypothetical protein
MALTTRLDIITLGTWSWLTDYTANRTAFIDLARIVYQILAKYALKSYNSPLGPDDMEGPLTDAIQTCDIFRLLCIAKQHARPALYPVFARTLAKYIIDNEWVTITRP